MKTTLVALLLTFSSTVFARQYIQCSTMDSNSTDVMVVNLQTEQGGTLFISSGMQNDESERLLVNIEFDKIEKKHHVYKVVGEAGQGFVKVPSEAIGKSSNFVMVDLSFNSYYFTFSCFARIYND